MNKWNIKIYQAKTWGTEIQVKFENETVWLNQEQISKLFWVHRPAITKHLKNIFESWELNEKEVSSILEHTTKHWALEGKTQTQKVKFYNLDAVISVWYRVNSRHATSFRIWATSILKDYLIKWYSINQNRLQENWYKELEKTLNIFKKTIKSWDLSQEEATWLLDIITSYTNTWLLLQNYDENKLSQPWKTKILNYKLEAKEAFESLMELKQSLKTRKEATDLFANPINHGSLAGIFWNIYQTFWWKELYNTVEEKAANLLYFIVKDHPFSDGNKRSGAFLFILFLAKNHILFDTKGNKKINDRALVAITLLIAESNPKDKEIMVRLLVNLIN
jgi:prophage maintenance system killer protein